MVWTRWEDGERHTTWISALFPRPTRPPLTSLSRETSKFVPSSLASLLDSQLLRSPSSFGVLTGRVFQSSDATGGCPTCSDSRILSKAEQTVESSSTSVLGTTWPPQTARTTALGSGAGDFS